VLAELRRTRLPKRGYLFLRRDGERGPNTPSMLSELANDHLHACGIPATLHQLRHRFGSRAYQGSHDLRLVQELLGHASPEMTAGYAAYDNAAALPGPCKGCGRTFTPASPNSRYHSLACRQAADRRQRRAATKGVREGKMTR
jgi:hypothetical protein